MYIKFDVQHDKAYKYNYNIEFEGGNRFEVDYDTLRWALEKCVRSVIVPMMEDVRIIYSFVETCVDECMLGNTKLIDVEDDLFCEVAEIAQWNVV